MNKHFVYQLTDAERMTNNEQYMKQLKRIEGSKWTFREFNMTELLVVTRPTERSRASEAMFTMNFVFKDCKRKSLSIVWTLMNFYVI